jgi:hypothetical protein
VSGTNSTEGANRGRAGRGGELKLSVGPREFRTAAVTASYERHDRLLTVEDVADMLQMSPAWVRAHANGRRKPELRSVKCGKCHRFRREVVEQFVKSLEVSVR